MAWAAVRSIWSPRAPFDLLASSEASPIVVMGATAKSPAKWPTLFFAFFPYSLGRGRKKVLLLLLLQELEDSCGGC